MWWRPFPHSPVSSVAQTGVCVQRTGYVRSKQGEKERCGSPHLQGNWGISFLPQLLVICHHVICRQSSRVPDMQNWKQCNFAIVLELQAPRLFSIGILNPFSCFLGLCGGMYASVCVHMCVGTYAMLFASVAPCPPSTPSTHGGTC